MEVCTAAWWCLIFQLMSQEHCIIYIWAVFLMLTWKIELFQTTTHLHKFSSILPFLVTRSHSFFLTNLATLLFNLDVEIIKKEKKKHKPNTEPMPTLASLMSFNSRESKAPKYTFIYSTLLSNTEEYLVINVFCKCRVHIHVRCESIDLTQDEVSAYADVRWDNNLQTRNNIV